VTKAKNKEEALKEQPHDTNVVRSNPNEEAKARVGIPFMGVSLEEGTRPFPKRDIQMLKMVNVVEKIIKSMPPIIFSMKTSKCLTRTKTIKWLSRLSWLTIP